LYDVGDSRKDVSNLQVEALHLPKSLSQ
jgi:hypothetical protein